MALTFYRKKGSVCRCGCQCDPLEYWQIRVFKSRMVGFEPFVEEEEPARYLKAEYTHSCAWPCGTGRENYWCPSLKKCDDSCTTECCNYEPVTATKGYDRFRGCVKVLSDCDLLAPYYTPCPETERTATTLLTQCDTSPMPCCEAWETGITLSEPYTVAMLKEDVAEMRGEVEWSDFKGPNTGGDVVGLEEGQFIFPHGPQTYHDAHYYTDEEETYIDKAWLKITNPTEEDISVIKRFVPMDGGPETTEEIVIEAGESVEIEPPEEPGTVTAGQPCVVYFVPVDQRCQTRSKTATVDEFWSHCTFCSYVGDKEGYRTPYKKESLVGTSNVSWAYELTTTGFYDEEEGWWYSTKQNQSQSGSLNVTVDRECSELGHSVVCTAKGDNTWTEDVQIEEGWGGTVYTENYGSNYNYGYDISEESGSCYYPGGYATNINLSTYWDGGSDSCEDEECNSWTWIGIGPFPIVEPTCVTENEIEWPRSALWPGPALADSTYKSEITRTEDTLTSTATIENPTPKNSSATVSGSQSTTVVLTLSESIFADEVKDGDEWEEEGFCESLCASFFMDVSASRGDGIAYIKNDLKWKLRFDQITSPSPEACEEIEVLVRWWKIVSGACEVPIEATLEERTHTLARSGSEGSYEWPPIPDETGELDAYDETGGESGSACIRYATAIVVSVTEPEP